MRPPNTAERQALRRIIDVAQGAQPADAVIAGGKLANVLTGELYDADVAISGSRIATVGDVGHTRGPGTTVIDAAGMVLVPGLIDQHAHVHESQLSVTEFAAAVVPRGTAAIATDFYGEMVVGGLPAVRASLEAASTTPLRVWLMGGMPAYYQNRPFGHSGTPTREEMLDLLRWDDCRGIDDTSSSRIVRGDDTQLEIVDAVQAVGKKVSGHGAGLTAHQSAAWIGYCRHVDDHECISAEEAVEKARLGIRIVVREGSGVYNLDAVVAAITEHGVDPRRFCFCTDVPSALAFDDFGHIDHLVRLAIERGVAPMTALQMATINAAECLMVDDDHGSISPGKFADIALVDSLESFRVQAMVSDGRYVAENGRLLERTPPVRFPQPSYETMKVERRFTADDFRLPVTATGAETQVRVIVASGQTALTEEVVRSVPVVGGAVEPDPSRDLLLIAAIERVRGTGEMAVGLVEGYGLRHGAIATTFNSQAENLMVLGASAQDMAVAANALVDCGGGFVLVEDGAVVELLELPLFGLQSERPYEEVAATLRRLNSRTAELGCPMPEPFPSLGFTGTPVEVPTLKIAPEGLVDVGAAKTVPLEVATQ